MSIKSAIKRCQLLDNRDREILYLIYEHQEAGAFIPHARVAELIGVSRDTVSYRLRKLRQANLISCQRSGRKEWVYQFEGIVDRGLQAGTGSQQQNDPETPDPETPDPEKPQMVIDRKTEKFQRVSDTETPIYDSYDYILKSYLISEETYKNILALTLKTILELKERCFDNVETNIQSPTNKNDQIRSTIDQTSSSDVNIKKTRDVESLDYFSEYCQRSGGLDLIFDLLSETFGVLGEEGIMRVIGPKGLQELLRLNRESESTSGESQERVVVPSEKPQVSGSPEQLPLMLEEVRSEPSIGRRHLRPKAEKKAEKKPKKKARSKSKTTPPEAADGYKTKPISDYNAKDWVRYLQDEASQRGYAPKSFKEWGKAGTQMLSLMADDTPENLKGYLDYCVKYWPQLQAKYGVTGSITVGCLLGFYNSFALEYEKGAAPKIAKEKKPAHLQGEWTGDQPEKLRKQIIDTSQESLWVVAATKKGMKARLELRAPGGVDVISYEEFDFSGDAVIAGLRKIKELGWHRDRFVTDGKLRAAELTKDQ